MFFIDFSTPHVTEATRTIQYGHSSNEAPGSPAPALEAELRRIQEENIALREEIAGMSQHYNTECIPAEVCV